MTIEDILVFEFDSDDGKKFAAVYADGLIDKQLLGEVYFIRHNFFFYFFRQSFRAYSVDKHQRNRSVGLFAYKNSFANL